jgi:SAM-dependent methyltransferase
MLKKKIKSAVKVFKEKFPNYDYPEVLDVGCREGFSTQYLMKAGYNVTGIDIESKWVDHNKKKGRDILWGDFLEFDFDPAYVDAVFSRHCIEHTGSVEKFLRKCRDILIDNGVLFLIFPLQQTVLLDMGKDDEKDKISHNTAFSYFQQLAGLDFKEEYFGQTKEAGIIPMDNDYLFIGRKI